MSDDKDVATIIQAVPAQVVQEVYNDLASPALQEGGKLVADITKTIRLALFPFQVASAWQDRLSQYIDKAIRQVPEERRIAPMESTLLPVAERLRFQEESNSITALYINLLSRAMDGERVGEVHPAFVSVISQMAPDEVCFIAELAKHNYTVVIQLDYDAWRTPLDSEISGVIALFSMSLHQIQLFQRIVFRYNRLNQPEMFKMFLDHLTFLGLVEYTSDPAQSEFQGATTHSRSGPHLHFIRLSLFGKLFFRACMSEAET